MEGLFSKVDTLDLQGISCHRVALQICHSYVSNSSCSDKSEIQKRHRDALISVFGLCLDYRSDLDKAVEFLMVPQPIKHQLKSALTRVVNEIVDWLLELSKTITVNVYDLNWCVWSSKGKIDYKQSAMRILSTVNELSEPQKFAIMSEYCLEDELAKVKFDLKSQFRTIRLFEYWYLRIKNDLASMKRTQDISLSLDADMALCCLRQHVFQRWTAFEYFWHRMDTDQQTRVVNKTFNTFQFGHISAPHLERLLGMLSHEQHSRLLYSCHDSKVVDSFVRRKDSLKVVRWPLLTAKMFASTVSFLINRKSGADEWMNWLIELWDSASDQLKNFAAEATEYDVRNAYKLSPCALKLYCRIIPLQSAEMRYNTILKLAYDLKTEIDHDSFDELLKAYVPSTKDQSNCEAKFSYVKNVCLKLLLLLKSHAIAEESFSYQVGKWNALNEFIDLMSIEIDCVLLRWKYHLFTSCIYGPTSYKGSDAHDVTKLIEIVESEFPEDVEDLKCSLFHSFQEMLENSTYLQSIAFLNEMYYHRFVKWCVGGGDRAVLEYEGGAFVNTVFEKVLNALDELYSRLNPSQCRLDESLLCDLDKCLLLFLISEDEVKKYKLDRMTSFHGLKIYQSISKEDDELSREKLLNWFFHNNQSAVRNFKSKKLKTK